MSRGTRGDVQPYLALAVHLQSSGHEVAIVSTENFRDFVFTNPVKFFAGSNPDFFNGTKVEAEANRLLAEGL